MVEHAIKVGYRHVDSATAYRNEAPSATGMMKPGIPREELFFTSKVPPRSISYAAAAACVDETLKQTGLDYIDLYLLHAPYGGKEGRLGAWKALVEAVEAGKIRSIGVSNYGVHHLEELEEYIKSVEAKEGKGKGGVLSVNQVELHPWLARPDIVKWCKDRGVLLQVILSSQFYTYAILINLRPTVQLFEVYASLSLLSSPLPRNTRKLHHRFCYGGVSKWGSFHCQRRSPSQELRKIQNYMTLNWMPKI